MRLRLADQIRNRAIDLDRRERNAANDCGERPLGVGTTFSHQPLRRLRFYEKVMFSCRGRIISSFALIYPIASKAMFDPIVEGIEKTFRPTQNCGPYARP